jgi:hypothetical protein
MTKAFKLVSARAISGLVAGAIEAASKATEMVHVAAVQSCAHTEAHGDWTLLKTLMVGLKNSGFRMQGVRIWIEHFTPIRFPADKTAEGGFTIKVLRPEADDYTPWDIKGMWETPFTDFEPANERVGQAKDAEGIAKQFQRLLENTANDGTPIDPTKPYYPGDVRAVVTAIGQVVAKRIKATNPDQTGAGVNGATPEALGGTPDADANAA